MRCFRYGEALHPRPAAPQDFVLSCCNPSGLHGKAQVLSHNTVDSDVIAVSETHLTTRSLRMFRAGLALSGPPFKHCVGGHPVPPRGHSVFAGGWTGVATVSKHPRRLVPTPLPASVYASSRVQVVMWIVGGTLYGEPAGPAHPEQKAHTELLLQAVVEQVCFHAHGLRYLAGDFNVDLLDMPSYTALQAAGFVDVQDLAYARWGRPIQMTCKQATRRDYLLLSPELQALVTDVLVDQTVWADHAVLSAVCHGSCQSVALLPPFNGQMVLCWTCLCWIGPLTRHRPARRVCILSPSVRVAVAPPFGRNELWVLLVRLSVVVVQVRSQPQFFGQSLRHAQWFRQLRRLQSLVRSVRKLDDPSQDSQSLAVWNSVLNAKGFDTSFSIWWFHCSFRVPGAPASLPVIPPRHSDMMAVYESMLLAVRDLEATLAKSLRAFASTRRAHDPALVFKDIRRAPPGTIDLLTNSVGAKVIEHRPHDLSVVLDRSCDWKSETPFFLNGTVVSVVHAEPDCVWLSALDGVAVGHRLCQTHFTGHVDDLFLEFRKAWSARWTPLKCS